MTLALPGALAHRHSRLEQGPEAAGTALGNPREQLLLMAQGQGSLLLGRWGPSCPQSDSAQLLPGEGLKGAGRTRQWRAWDRLGVSAAGGGEEWPGCLLGVGRSWKGTPAAWAPGGCSVGQQGFRVGFGSSQAGKAGKASALLELMT